MSMRGFIAALIFAGLAAASPGARPAAAADCPRRPYVTELGTLFGVGQIITPQKNPFEIGRGDTSRYLRARLRVTNAAASCRWYVTVRDREYRVVQTITREDFCGGQAACRDGSIWTNRVPGSKAFIDFQSCDAGAASPAVRVEEYVAMPDKARAPYYSTQDDIPRWQPLYAQGVENRFRTWGDHVGFMVTSWNRRHWSCSGVLVAPDLFLTNWHCGGDSDSMPESGFWNNDVVNDVVIDFSWDDDRIGHDFIARRVVTSSRDLDFALLEVQPVSPGGGGRPARLSLAPPSAGDDLWLVHHPLGEQKRVSSCAVVKPEFAGWMPASGKSDLTHECDTEGGSSGAPVFNARGEVVGLHHLGFQLDEQCKPVEKVNKAVRIDSIVKKLCSNNAHKPYAEKILGGSCPQ